MKRLAICLALGACATNRLPSQSVERLELGRFHARALFQNQGGGRPVVVLVPGSGPTGAESLIPPEYGTLSGKEEPILSQMAEAFQRAGLSTLQLGKPGIEFNRGKGIEYYDQDMHNKLTWPDYLGHLEDAIDWVSAQPGVGPIILLGHSEGTVLALDGAVKRPAQVKGLVLLGFVAESFESNTRWQLIDREVEWFLARDVDTNKDGVITHEEMSKFPETFWFYQIPEGTSLTFAQAREKMAGFREWLVQGASAAPLYQGVFSRSDNLERAASLKAPVVAITGALDVATPAKYLPQLQAACAAKGKTNCLTEMIPELGHGFAEPKGPGKQPLLDATLGGIDPRAQAVFERIGRKLRADLGSER